MAETATGTNAAFFDSMLTWLTWEHDAVDGSSKPQLVPVSPHQVDS